MPASGQSSRAHASAQEAGFAAGTWIHTARGLVPIEDIQVGDLVMTTPQGDGDRAYQAVSKLLVQNFRPVMLMRVDYHVRNGGASEYIIATADQGFFARKALAPTSQTEPAQSPQWTGLADLAASDAVELLTGDAATVGGVDALYFSGTPGIAIAPRSHTQWSDGGWAVDLGARPIAVNAVTGFPCSQVTSPCVLVTVYQLEVQGSGTYYVGKVGLQVRGSGQAAVPRASLSPRVRKLMARVAEQGEPLADLHLDDMGIPQYLAQLPADEASHAAISVPNRLKIEHLDALARAPAMLLQQGRVVWGHTVRANDDLLEEGECGNLGAVLYDPSGRLKPAALRPLALELAEHFGGELIAAALRPQEFRLDEQFCGEWACPIAMPVPQPHGPNALMVTGLYFDRKHLPNGMLVLDYYPLLISDGHPGVAMLLPSRWWPQAYRSAWDAPMRARLRGEWDDYWYYLAHDRSDQDAQQLQDSMASIQHYAHHGIDDACIALLTKLGSPGFQPTMKPAPLEWEWELDAHLDSLAEVYVTDVERARARGSPLLVGPARQAFAMRYMAQMLGLHRLMLQPLRGYQATHGAFYADEIQYVALGLVVGCEEPALRMARMLCAAWQHPHIYSLVRPQVRAIYMVLAQHMKLPIPVLNACRDAPRLDALLDGNCWLHLEAGALAPLLEAACMEHTETAADGPFRGLPIALVLMLKLRAQQGRHNPRLVHPLLASPLGDWPTAVQLEAVFDPLLRAVRKRLAAHAYDEDAIEAAVIHGQPLAVPAALGRPARLADRMPVHTAAQSTTQKAFRFAWSSLGHCAALVRTAWQRIRLTARSR